VWFDRQYIDELYVISDFFKSFFMFYLYMIQTTCIYNWTNLFDLDRLSIPCDWTDNISLNFKYIFVWIFIFFYLYNVHDIYYTSIMIVDVRSGPEGFTGVIHS
jgi:hypothetical protein